MNTEQFSHYISMVMIVTVLAYRYLIKLLALATLGKATHRYRPVCVVLPKMAKASRLIRYIWPVTVTVVIHRYLINLLALTTSGKAAQIEMILLVLHHPRWLRRLIRYL